jgi:predicted NBD/HSP70 family sugar kinase
MKTLNAPGDINLSRVLRLIWQIKGISRIEIAQQLGIDKSTVTKIVATLEEIGIIRAFAQGEAGPQGGRKPIQLEIIPEFGAAVGIEINTDGFQVTVVDLHGKILGSAQDTLNFTSVHDSFDAAIAKATPVIESLNLPILGIGVGVPSIVNTDKGTIIQSIPLMISEETEFCSWARKKYDTPVYIENDARCGCLGELTLRHGVDIDNALFLLAEIRKITGSTKSRKNLSVGCGFIINGQTMYGNEFTAGEFRSLLWKPGNSGQFQSSDLSQELIGTDSSVTGSVFSELAAHVAFLVNVLNLNMVFLCGLPADLTESLAGRIRHEIVMKWPYELNKRCDVRTASLGNLAVAYGAAGHCLQRFFSLPNISEPSRNGPSIKESLESLREN